MPYEYRKLDLNPISAKLSDIDLLNEAGKDHWRLLFMNPNNIGYFIRDVPEPEQPTRRARARTPTSP